MSYTSINEGKKLVDFTLTETTATASTWDCGSTVYLTLK